MKIGSEPHLPTITNPYDGDIFNRVNFGASLKRLVKNVEDSAVICLDEKWGMGKSTFVRMWVKDLERENIRVINVNAFENEIFGPPLTTFTSEITSLLEDQFPKAAAVESAIADLKVNAIAVGKKILLSTLKVSIKAATAGLVDLAGIENAIVTDGLAEAASDLVKSEEEDVSSRKNQVNRLRESLQKIAAYVRKTQSFPLLIIVDELDRCSPEYSLQMLEQIAHFFGVQSVVFLIPCNLEQISNHVSHKYGIHTDGNQYLQKFFNIRISFPRNDIRNSSNPIELYLTKSFRERGVSDLVQEMTAISELCSFYDISLREIDQIAALMAVYRASFPKERISFMILNIFLAILKTKFPALFKSILNRTCSYHEVIKGADFTRFLQQTKNRSKADFLNLVLKYHFYTEEEMSNSAEKEELSRYDQLYFMYSVARTDVLAIYCEDINSFIG